MKNINFIKEENYNIWSLSENPKKIIMYLYSEGQHKDAEEIIMFVDQMRESVENVVIIAVNYYGTSLKYDSNSVEKLESKVPEFLTSIGNFLTPRHRILLEQENYQKIIDDLYFMEYFDYVVNEETVIPFFGNDEYNDFGVLAAMSVITQMNMIKKLYPYWPWESLISIGTYYGGYLAEMIEKIRPHTFSMILSKNSLLFPRKDDLFMNYTEWKHGEYRIFMKKMFGKLVLPLVDEFGWTSNLDHEYAFKPRHFDIRNNLNKQYWNREINNKDCLRVFSYDLANPRVGLDLKDLISRLKENDYSVEYAEELSLFELYMKYKSNKYQLNSEIKESYVVTSEGCYFFNDLDSSPQKEFLITSDLDDSITFRNRYLESQNMSVDEKYTMILDVNSTD